MKRERTFTWDDPTPLWERVAGLTGLQCLQLIIDGELPGPPMARLMDIRLVEIAPGRAIFASTPREYHYNPLGTIHGGFGATVLIRPALYFFT